MFDNVGKNNDAEATRRSFASLLLSALTLGGGAAFVVGWGAYTAVQIIQDEAPPDQEMVEVVIEDLPLEASAPPPPPPPPPPAAADVEDETDEDDTKVETEEMVEEQKELAEEVKTEIKSEAREAGVKDGVEGGVKDGVVGGVKDGVKDGVIGGELGSSGVRTVHYSELEVKNRVTPEYPSAAESMNLGDQRCRVKVFIDEKGIPYQADVSDCPKVFHDAARTAILKWRWYPPKAGKERSKVQTLIAVLFKSR